ncbi:MAG: hypothetical protein ACLRIT_10310 [Blautia sp.]
MVDQIVMKLPERTKIQLSCAELCRGKRRHMQKLFERAKKSGYVRVIVDGNLYELSRRDSDWTRISNTILRLVGRPS